MISRPLPFLVALLVPVVIGLASGPDPVDRSTPFFDCEYTDEIPPIDDVEKLISFSDPYLGNHEADVTVIELFDPNCRHCKTIHPIMQSVIDENSDRARFYLIPFVLWQRSLVQVEALYVAAQDDKYHTMMDRQFHHQKPEGLTVEELGDIAAEIGMDREQFVRRLRQGLNQRSIVERRQQIMELGFDGTPAVIINGRVVSPSARSARCMNRMIADAAEAAEAAGAESRSG